MTSKFEFKKSLEWCTELPAKDCPRESPLFLANGSEWFFRFALQKATTASWCFFLYLELKCTHTEFKPCRGKLQVGFVEEQTLSLGNVAFDVSEPTKKQIWFNYVKDIQSKLSSDYLNCKGIKFIFSFDDLANSLLQICKEIEDKSVQTGSYLNVEVSVESSHEDFSKLLDAGTDHDAEIKCGEHSIKVHRIILCARSEVFSKMFQSDMKEGTSGIIKILDMDISYVQDFVRYLYTGAMPELTFDKAKILYEAGDKYAVRSLMIRCSEYMQDNLSPENAVQYFALADAHSDQNLKDRVKTYMLEEKVYLQDELMLPFCESFPREANEVYRLSYKRKISEINYL